MTEWQIPDGTAYGLLPAIAHVSRTRQLASAVHSVQDATWITAKVLFAAIAIPLILIFAIASFGAMFFPGKW